MNGNWRDLVKKLSNIYSTNYSAVHFGKESKLRDHKLVPRTLAQLITEAVRDHSESRRKI